MRLPPVLIACLCIPLLGVPTLPARAQGEETVPPPASQGPLKSWYPRLSGLPYSTPTEESISIAGRAYFNRQYQVTFFEGTPEEKINEILQSYYNDDIAQLEDGRTYSCTLSDKDKLLAAVDFMNDHPLVQGAQLLSFEDDGSTIKPSPFFPGSPASADSTTGGVEALRPGDVNRDQVWTVVDAVITLRAVVGLNPLDPFVRAQADINRTGHADVGDAVFTLGLALGMSLPPPYGYR